MDCSSKHLVQLETAAGSELHALVTHDYRFNCQSFLLGLSHHLGKAVSIRDFIQQDSATARVSLLLIATSYCCLVYQESLHSFGRHNRSYGYSSTYKTGCIIGVSCMGYEVSL